MTDGSRKTRLTGRIAKAAALTIAMFLSAALASCAGAGVPASTARPTEKAAAQPTEAATAQPTGEPTAKPTPEPTEKPTEAPTATPEPTYPLDERTAGNYTLKIMEFNIQAEGEGTEPPDVRGAVFRALLDETQPDVVGLQEATAAWYECLCRDVFNASYTDVGEPRDSGGEANYIFYRSDKFTLVEGGTFWLSATPDEPGSTVENSNLPRICTWVTLRDKTTGTEFSVLNTHLDHNGNNDSGKGGAVRRQQFGYIMRFAKQLTDRPLFLTGDLNARRTNNSGEFTLLYKMVTGQTPYVDADGTEYTLKLSDARIEAKETVPADRIACVVKYLDSNDKAYDPAREPVDYIFFSADHAEALTYDSPLYKKDGRLISDHTPLIATFRIFDRTTGD